MTNHEYQGHIRSPQDLQRIESLMFRIINQAHGRRDQDMTPIVVEPSPNPKPTPEAALQEIENARANLARAGLRTGPLTDAERAELGIK